MKSILLLVPNSLKKKCQIIWEVIAIEHFTAEVNCNERENRRDEIINRRPLPNDSKISFQSKYLKSVISSSS
jgi:hypothetical protein